MVSAAIKWIVHRSRGTVDSTLTATGETHTRQLIYHIPVHDNYNTWSLGMHSEGVNLSIGNGILSGRPDFSVGVPMMTLFLGEHDSG